MARSRRSLVAIAVAVLAAGALAAGLSRRPRPLELPLKQVRSAIAIDGALDDEAWGAASVRAGPFVDADGVQARPYSEIRAVLSDGALVLALYAADADIRTGGADRFELQLEAPLGLFSLAVTPDGKVTSTRRGDETWRPALRVGRDVDGTPDDASDDDEEWVIELAVPLEALGITGAGGRVGLSARRCDDPKDGPRACGLYPPPGQVLSLVTPPATTANP